MRFALFLLTICACPLSVQAENPPSLSEVKAAMKKAVGYYRTHVAQHGGYVYITRLDLKQRWGENEADPDTIYVQPPATPTVGMAFLAAYKATGDRDYLDAARQAAEALRYGQLQSGGWTQTIRFSPDKNAGLYRNGKGGRRNTSSLDDDQSQSALRFLMRLDQTLQFKDEKVHEATMYGLNALLAVQFANGAFPQVWTKPAQKEPILRASYPTYDWKTEGRFKNYWDYYTLNDGLAGTVAEVLIDAHEIYHDEKYLTALTRLGDFLLLAQMPAPQPGWCQQYSYEMLPIWARKFEPPAVTGSESQDVMETLITIANITGEKKYLDPIPKALAYYRTCLLPDGRLPRYLELKTNKPLYMTSNYQLTYDDGDVPKHYGWKVSSKLDSIEKKLEQAKKEPKKTKPKTRKQLTAEVKRILADLDEQGRWITRVPKDERIGGKPPYRAGYEFLSSAVFSRNIETLSDYLAAKD